MNNLRLEPEQISSFWMIPEIQIQIGLSGLSLACKTSKTSWDLSTLHNPNPALCFLTFLWHCLCSTNCLPVVKGSCDLLWGQMNLKLFLHVLRWNSSQSYSKYFGFTFSVIIQKFSLISIWWWGFRASQLERPEPFNQRSICDLQWVSQCAWLSSCTRSESHLDSGTYGGCHLYDTACCNACYMFGCSAEQTLQCSPHSQNKCHFLSQICGSFLLASPRQHLPKNAVSVLPALHALSCRYCSAGEFQAAR